MIGRSFLLLCIILIGFGSELNIFTPSSLKRKIDSINKYVLDKNYQEAIKLCFDILREKKEDQLIQVGENYYQGIHQYIKEKIKNIPIEEIQKYYSRYSKRIKKQIFIAKKFYKVELLKKLNEEYPYNEYESKIFFLLLQNYLDEKDMENSKIMLAKKIEKQITINLPREKELESIIELPFEKVWETKCKRVDWRSSELYPGDDIIVVPPYIINVYTGEIFSQLQDMFKYSPVVVSGVKIPLGFEYGAYIPKLLFFEENKMIFFIPQKNIIKEFEIFSFYPFSFRGNEFLSKIIYVPSTDVSSGQNFIKAIWKKNEIKWQTYIPLPISSSICEYLDKLIFLAGKRTIFSLNKENGEIIWVNEIEDENLSLYPSYAFYKGIIYFSSNSNDIIGISVDTGKIVFKKNIGFPGKIIGSKDELIIITNNTKVCGFNINKNEIVWTYIFSKINGIPTCDINYIYLPIEDEIHIIDINQGILINKYKRDSDKICKLYVKGNKLYILTQNDLTCLMPRKSIEDLLTKFENNNDYNALFLHAIYSGVNKEYEKAIIELKKVLKESPDKKISERSVQYITKYTHEYVKVLKGENKLDIAKALLENNLSQIDDENVRTILLYDLAQVYEFEGKNDDAVKIYQLLYKSKDKTIEPEEGYMINIINFSKMRINELTKLKEEKETYKIQKGFKLLWKKNMGPFSAVKSIVVKSIVSNEEIVEPKLSFVKGEVALHMATYDLTTGELIKEEPLPLLKLGTSPDIIGKVEDIIIFKQQYKIFGYDKNSKKVVWEISLPEETSSNWVTNKNNLFITTPNKTIWIDMLSGKKYCEINEKILLYDPYEPFKTYNGIITGENILFINKDKEIIQIDRKGNKIKKGDLEITVIPDYIRLFLYKDKIILDCGEKEEKYYVFNIEGKLEKIENKPKDSVILSIIDDVFIYRIAVKSEQPQPRVGRVGKVGSYIYITNNIIVMKNDEIIWKKENVRIKYMYENIIILNEKPYSFEISAYKGE